MGKKRWDRFYEEHERRKRERKERKKKEDHMSLHHILPRSRNGTNIPSNLLRMWFYEKHDPYHKMFGDRTLEEAIEFLKRVSRAVSKKKEPDDDLPESDLHGGGSLRHL